MGMASDCGRTRKIETHSNPSVHKCGSPYQAMPMILVTFGCWSLHIANCCHDEKWLREAQRHICKPGWHGNKKGVLEGGTNGEEKRSSAPMIRYVRFV